MATSSMVALGWHNVLVRLIDCSLLRIFLRILALPKPNSAEVVSQPLIAWITGSCSVILSPRNNCAGKGLTVN